MPSLLMLPLIQPILNRRQRYATLLPFAAMIVGAVAFVPETSWNRILQFGSQLVEGTLTHRTVIWAAGFETLRDHAFFGVGAGAYGTSILRIVDIPYVAHNTFLSVLVELGIVGALLWCGLIAGIVYSVTRMPYLERCLWLVVLMTWTIGVSALTWEYRKPTWLVFGLIIAHEYSRRMEENPRRTP